MQLDKLLHGGDYNPEQWLDRPDILAKDVELMEKAHVNVVTLGVFSWSTINQSEADPSFSRCTAPQVSLHSGLR